MFWSQGLETAPDLVRRCHESWVLRNPNWRIRMLDGRDLAGLGLRDYGAPSLVAQSPNHLSDLLRLDLLAAHGGIWADATCYCMRPLDEWLPDLAAPSGFFAFARPGPDRLLSSWFLAAQPDNHLVTRLRDWLADHWSRPFKTARGDAGGAIDRLLISSPRRRALWFSRPVRDWLGADPYFAFHYAFERLVRSHPECRTIWARTPKVSADGPHRLQAVGLRSPLSTEIAREIDDAAEPLYKLTWKQGPEPAPPGSVLAYLLNAGVTAPSE